jgi:hypothetical protein
MYKSRTWVVESQHDLRLVSAGHKPRRVARIIAGFTDRTRREAMGPAPIASSSESMNPARTSLHRHRSSQHPGT